MGFIMVTCRGIFFLCLELFSGIFWKNDSPLIAAQRKVVSQFLVRIVN